eukprot:TRINITY_DN8999_c0_g1_i1.p1 TRINITY_DN8999_c0_g1~~TRINITY_DN8999_c0_g1_i1.p1  ORF type:complete len:283 (-),score=50.83 TRINITY_DN8999_c0_g1_i1:76-924(-)
MNQIKIEEKNNQLTKEIDILKNKNEELQKIIQMRMFSTNQMWIISKLDYRVNMEDKMTYPIKSYIIEVSQSFQNLLGYENLINKSLDELIPKNHHQSINKNNMPIIVERIKDYKTPKLIYTHDLYFKHASGNFVRVLFNSAIYFDYHSNTPSIRIIYVNKILDSKVEEKSLPETHSKPQQLVYYTGTTNELSHFISLYQSPITPEILQKEVMVIENNSINENKSNFNQENHFFQPNNLSPNKHNNFTLNQEEVFNNNENNNFNLFFNNKINFQSFHNSEFEN